MAKKKNYIMKAIIRGIIIISFIFGMFAGNTLSFAQLATGRAMKELEAQEKTPKELPIDTSLENSIRQTQEQLAYTADKTRDPFEELLPIEVEGRVVLGEREEAPLPTLNVEGIVWGSDVPQAIINSTVLTIGDTIEEVTIIDINKEGVTVFFNNRTYILKTGTVQQEQ